MPPCEIQRYQDLNGYVPFDAWLATISSPGKTQHRIAAVRIAAALERLETNGHDLRRPTAAPLRDGVYELRVNVGNINYRALYFFAGRGIAVMAHGCTKECALDEADVDRAVSRRLAYHAAPLAHSAPRP